jgi:putative NADH-flavin reductase
MKLVVLGATGGTGLEIIKQTIEHGYSVTAFARTSEPLKRFGNRITVIQGDLLNSKTLETVVEGHDAVLSSFGARKPVSKEEADIRQRFAIALTKAMQQTGVKRLVAVSTALLFNDSIIPPAYIVGRLFFREVIGGASKMEHIITKSGLNWTIVRPPKLTDKPYSGKYRMREGHLPAFGFTISRADVADFVIKTMENRASIRKTIGICN